MERSFKTRISQMKLRTILSVLFVLALFSAPIGGYLYYFNIKQSVLNEGERQILLHVEQVKSQMASGLLENLKIIKALAGLPELKSILQKPDKLKSAESNDILTHFQQTLKFTACYLINRKGTAIASSDHDEPNSLIGKNYAAKSYFKKAIKGQTVVEMIMENPNSHRAIYYVCPVFRNKKTIGIIVLKSSDRVIESYFKDPGPGIWILRNKNGVILASNKEGWLYRMITLVTHSGAGAAGEDFPDPGGWLDRIRFNQISAKYVADSTGREYFIRQYPIDPVFDWEIIYLLPRDYISGIVASPMLRNTGAIILISCLLMVVTVFFLFREANRDLSQRKKVEEEIRQLKEFNENIVQNMTEGIIVQDAHGRFTFINPAAARLLGYEPHELLGKYWQSTVPVDQQPIIVAANQRRMQGQSDRYEVELIHKNGQPLYVHISGQPIFEKKAFAGTLAVFSDITARKKAEREIKRLSSAMEQSIDGIAISDLETRIVYVNPSFAQIHEYAPAEMIGMPFEALHRFLEQENSQSIAERIMPTGSWIGEMEGVRKESATFTAYVSYNLLKDDQGKPQGILAVIRDISKQKRLEAQFQQVQKLEAIGTLAGGIAHNFNNLLMGVQGNASLMLLETDLNHPHYKMLKNIEKLVQNGAKLTGQLLGYAREGKYEIRPLDLNLIVKDTAETFGMTKKEIKVFPELDPALLGIMADQGQVEQVLLNLYVNAADAMPGGGNLFIQTKNVTEKEIPAKDYKVLPGNYTMLLVRDTGVGMDEHTIKRIFDPFFTTKGLGRGTGLGLSSVYGIVKAHNGYIDVESRQGHGSTFRIYLPGVAEKTTVEKKSGSRVIKGSGTILLVDDEEQIVEVGKMMLMELGYQALAAKSGQEALEILKAHAGKTDLIILDMIMPDMSGSETFDRIKQIDPSLKILLASGYHMDGRANKILQRGCNGFIEKPFDLATLSGKIKEILWA